MDKIGIFGGTFNPPHVVHVKMVEEAMRQIHFDKMLIIPTYLPPHKEVAGVVLPEDRLEMARLAFAHIQSVEVSDLEIRRAGKSYTYDTVCEIEKQYPEAQIFVIIGEDMLETLEKWYRAEALIKKAHFFVFDRGGYNTDMGGIVTHLQATYGAKITVSDMAPIEKSSTEIRAYGVRQDVPLSVEQYIKENKLYTKESADGND